MTSVDSTPDSAPDSVPDPAPDATRDATSDATSASVPESTARGAAHDAARVPGQAAPGTEPGKSDVEPGGRPDTDHADTGSSAPGTDPGNPGVARGDRPRPDRASTRPALDIRVAEGLLSFLARVSGRPRGTYQAALLRIGFGGVFLATLLREFFNRREIWGDRSPWSADMSRRLLDGIDGVSILLVRDDRWWFELMYVFAVAVTVMFVLGRYTRAMSVLFCVMVVSFNSRSLLMTDGGDNVLTLMSFYLMFTACGRVWSLDARNLRRTGRSRSPGPGQEPGVFVALFAAVAVGLVTPWWLSLIGAVVVLLGMWRLPLELEQFRAAVVAAAHHCALFVIAAQVCVVYATAGLLKVQGVAWQDGTAMHYVLNLEYFQPWPGLSAIADGGPVMSTVVAYATVLTQVGFTFLVFAKRPKYVVVAILLVMHLGIALLLGLPAFSASMALGDLIFLPTAFLLYVRSLVGRRPSTADA